MAAAECEQIYQRHWRIKTWKRNYILKGIVLLWYHVSVSRPLLNTPAAISLHNNLSCSACPAILDATRCSAICWLSRWKCVEQLYLAWNSLCWQVPDAVCNIAGPTGHPAASLTSRFEQLIYIRQTDILDVKHNVSGRVRSFVTQQKVPTRFTQLRWQIRWTSLITACSNSMINWCLL
jgi:hypothetical protein